MLIALCIIVYLCGYSNEGFMDAQRCSVDLPRCTDGLRCINGYCKSDVAPTLPQLSDLLMTPPTKY